MTSFGFGAFDFAAVGAGVVVPGGAGAEEDEVAALEVPCDLFTTAWVMLKQTIKEQVI
jgi:hypothetical protein